MRGQENPGLSNAGVMENVSGTIAGRIMSAAGIRPGDTVSVDVARDPQNLLFAHACASTFQKNGLHVFLEADSSRQGGTVVAISSANMSVAYSKLENDEQGGPARLTRKVNVSVSAAIRRDLTGTSLPASRYAGSATDTVEFQSAGQLENPSMPWTHSEIPHEGGIDRFVEPFVIIGATAVAIYLFFSLRS